MREIIQASFGKESNYLQTHFWNFQDEQLKIRSDKLNKDGKGGAENAEMVDDQRFQAQMQSAAVLFYQQRESGQMTPRVIYTDFRDNFGNFSSCFSLEKQSQFDRVQTDPNSLMAMQEESKEPRTQLDTWGG